jgi:putative ABC transport system permease protein
MQSVNLYTRSLFFPAMALISDRLFELPPRLHPGLWLALPLAGALLVGTSGWLTTRVPPMQLIRELG